MDTTCVHLGAAPSLGQGPWGFGLLVWGGGEEYSVPLHSRAQGSTAGQACERPVRHQSPVCRHPCDVAESAMCSHVILQADVEVGTTVASATFQLRLQVCL